MQLSPRKTSIASSAAPGRGVTTGSSRMVMLAAVLLCCSGCTEEEELLPCPAKGLGVESKNGKACSLTTSLPAEDQKDCADQITNARSYDCPLAQICPDTGSRRITDYVITSTSYAETMSFILLNCSSGDQKLTISSIKIYGDSRCSFLFNKSNDVDSWEVAPGESANMRVLYKPATKGQDHAQVRIISNAQNFPTLKIPICAIANTVLPDAGAGDASTAVLTCQNVGDTINTKCH